MACGSAPVVMAAHRDFTGEYNTTYLGGPGDQAHQVRVSGHNCGSLQESGMRHPQSGAWHNYADQYAHALDSGHGGNRLVAGKIRDTYLFGPRRLDVRYVIDNARIYYPAWRGGGSSGSSGHGTHVHCSFTPWSTHNVTSFFGAKKMTAAVKKTLMKYARDKAARRPTLRGVSWRLHNRQNSGAIKAFQILSSLPVTGRYGLRTRRKAAAWRKFFGLPDPTSPRVDQELWEVLYFIRIAQAYGY